MLLLFLCFAGALGQSFRAGCVTFCGVSDDTCLNKCQYASGGPDQSENALKLQSLTKLPTTTEITGSDMYTIASDGQLYFTTREGDIYRFIPLPPPGHEVATKIYSLPESLRLDTRNDKGLYDIAFLRNFNRSRTFYLSYASLPSVSDPTDVDHFLNVAEFYFAMGEIATFSKIIERIPQTVPYRSGGFLKSAGTPSVHGFIPLRLSSGGNQNHDPALLKSEPRYSSLYDIFPERGLRVDPQHAKPRPAYVIWANGLANPYECDYAPLGFSKEIVCLTRHYDENNELSLVALFKAENGHTYNEETMATLQTNGYNTYQTQHTYTDAFDPTAGCVPDSIIFSGSNFLGPSYYNRIILATPTCAEGDFPVTTLQILIRNSEERKWELMPLPVDVEKRRLWGLQLIGAELSAGLFLGGRDLTTGDYEIYWIRKKN